MKAAKIEQYEILGTCLGSGIGIYYLSASPSCTPLALLSLATMSRWKAEPAVRPIPRPDTGVEDFDVCAQHYPEIEVLVPVDKIRKLTELAGEFAGSQEDANKAIASKLESTGNLFAIEKIIHQYPHCWRCKDP
jgi:isoleucyl-tRNA synthetase